MIIIFISFACMFVVIYYILFILPNNKNKSKKLTQKELNHAIKLHEKWLNNEKDGIRMDLSEKDLSGLNLNNAKLNCAELNHAKLNHAKLNHAKLNDAKLNFAKLNYAELNYAELNYAELNHAKLNGAELNDAKLNHAKLNDAELNRSKLNGAELNGAELNDVELNYTELNDADLNDVELCDCQLCNINLSGIKNSPFFNQYKWMEKNFRKDSEGFFVYKRIGYGDTQFDIPNNWEIKSGSFIEEVVNMNRTNECGCGVNFGNVEYIKNHYIYAGIWLCKLYFEDICELCVPINTDGKARCSRLKLLRKISVEEMEKF